MEKFPDNLKISHMAEAYQMSVAMREGQRQSTPSKGAAKDLEEKRSKPQGR